MMAVTANAAAAASEMHLMLDGRIERARERGRGEGGRRLGLDAKWIMNG
jgi:hypothetical protein